MARVSASIASSAARSYTAPRITTASIARVAAISSSGFSREQRDTSGDRALAQSLIDSFFLALHQRAPAAPGAAARGGIAPYMVADLRAWIELNLDRKIGVQDMADRLGYSCAHFAREFRREVGVTPHGFLQDIRLSTAMELARRGNPLIDIAHQCGFADQAHLSNAFKSRFGFSPASLRQRSN